jgi:uncharacterized membrane protein YeaQ/YmgE (transglycosylase-associated protein family)
MLIADRGQFAVQIVTLGRYTGKGSPAAALGLTAASEEILMDTMAATEFLARSTTLTNVGWISYIFIGAIAGWIAGKIVKGGGSGIVMNIVIGIIGALLGGLLLSFFLDTAGGGWWFTLFTAVLGSVILLWLVGLVKKT